MGLGIGFTMPGLLFPLPKGDEQKYHAVSGGLRVEGLGGEVANWNWEPLNLRTTLNPVYRPEVNRPVFKGCIRSRGRRKSPGPQPRA